MSTNALRIVHVFRAPLGGLFRHVIDLSVEQAARGHQIGLYFDSGGDSARVRDAIARIPGGPALGVGVHPISRSPSLSDFAAMRNFRGWLRQVRPDVVHGHGSKGGLYGRLSSVLDIPGKPVHAYTPHGGSFNYQPGTRAHELYMFVERLLSRHTELFLFESDHIRRKCDAAVGISQGGVRRVVVNGLREEEFTRAKPRADAADFVYVGELRAAKGIDTLLDALVLIWRTRGVAPSAVMVGSGPDRDSLIARARALGLDDKVDFPGPMPIRDALSRGRILVVPSRAESMPYVVLEGAAAAMPLIATNVGGIPEILGPFQDRLGPSDDPRDLARRMIDLMETPVSLQIAQAESLAAHVRIHFSIKNMADAILDSYQDALAARNVGKSSQKARPIAA